MVSENPFVYRGLGERAEEEGTTPHPTQPPDSHYFNASRRQSTVHGGIFWLVFVVVGVEGG